MKKFNELQQNIIREEFARTIMIQKARSVLNEAQFSLFINELRDYEDNLVLTESNQGEFIYEGLLDRLKNLGKGLANKIAPDNLQKIDQLAAQLADVDADLDTAKEIGRTPNEIKALEVKRNVLLKQLAAIDPGYAQQAQKAADEEDSSKGGGGGGGDTPDADDLAKNPKAQQAAAKIDQQADGVADQLENPKAGSIWSSIVDSYKYAFAANGAMWKNVFGFFTKTKKAPPARQDDMLIQLLMQLVQQQQGGQMKGAPDPQKAKEDAQNAAKDGSGEEKTDETGDETGDGANKEYKVADIQDKIILALNKVLDFKDVDLSRKDTMELAKKLTKNLVDQMVSNGIKFKGMSAQVNEAILQELDKRYMLLEEEEEEKESASSLDRFINMRVKRFSKSPERFLKALKNIKREFATKGYGKKEVFKKYVNTDVEQEFVGLYDLYLDIKGLEGAERILKKKAKEGDKNATSTLKKADNVTIKINNKVEKGRKLSSIKVHFANFYKVSHDKTLSPDHPTEIKKYRDLKMKGARLKGGGKDAKDMYKPEKVKTFDLPSGKKGMINVKNLIFQALKGLQMDKDQVQDIEKMLNKRLQGVVKQYIAKGMDINVLEEKLNRYATSVVKQLNEGS